MSEEKPILSIETSGSLCGVCVYFNDEKFYEAAAHLKNSHAEKLFELIDFVVKSSGIGVKDFGAIAVSAGPGSFTGLRIGMSAAKGIAFGSLLPIIPVSTFEALAYQISDFLPAGTEFIIANKVNLEEIYFAKFRSKPGNKLSSSLSVSSNLEEGSSTNTSLSTEALTKSGLPKEASTNKSLPSEALAKESLIDKSNNYIFVENLKIVDREKYQELKKDCPVFGNAGLEYSDEIILGLTKIEAPRAFYIARWSRLFGQYLMTRNYDYLEPNYLKNFIVRERKK